MGGGWLDLQDCASSFLLKLRAIQVYARGKKLDGFIGFFTSFFPVLYRYRKTTKKGAAGASRRGALGGKNACGTKSSHSFCSELIRIAR